MAALKKSEQKTTTVAPSPLSFGDALDQSITSMMNSIVFQSLTLRSLLSVQPLKRTIYEKLFQVFLGSLRSLATLVDLKCKTAAFRGRTTALTHAEQQRLRQAVQQYLPKRAEDDEEGKQLVEHQLEAELVLEDILSCAPAKSGTSGTASARPSYHRYHLRPRYRRQVAVTRKTRK